MSRGKSIKLPQKSVICHLYFISHCRKRAGRFVIVTADSTEGHEGNYRVGFSETAEYDPDHIKMNENVSLADLKKGLEGLANGSMVIGENRLEGVKAQENAPAGGESVVGDQVSAEGLNEAQRGGNAGNARRALTQTYEKQIETWDGKTEGFSFVLGNTSPAIQDIEVDGKKVCIKQVRIDATKIKKILSDHSEMTIDIIKQLPEVINNPILILDSKTVAGRLVLFGEVYAQNGVPVRVILELNPSTRSKKRNKVYAKVTKIASAFAQGNLQNFIDTSNIRYKDESRIDEWLKVNRLQLPLPNAHSNPATTSIPQNPKKSTTSGEKVSEEDNGSGRKALPTKRAARCR